MGKSIRSGKRKIDGKRYLFRSGGFTNKRDAEADAEFFRSEVKGMNVRVIPATDVKGRKVYDVYILERDFTKETSCSLGKRKMKYPEPEKLLYR